VLLSVFSGCGRSNTPKDTAAETGAPSTESAAPAESTAAVSADPLKVTFLYLADENPRMKEYLSNELKDQLKKDLNLELEVQFLPWSAYGPGQKVDMMIAAGEPFDMAMTDHNWLNQDVQKKMVYDLTELVDKYAPDLKANMDKEAFENYTFDGKLYALPVGGKPTSSSFYSICVRQDILEEVGMSEITSIADLEKFADLAKAKHPDMYATTDYNMEEYMRGYTDKLYTTSYSINGVMADETDGTLLPVLGSDVFKAHVDFMNRLYKKGLIPKDILTNKTTNPFETGKYLWFRGTCGTTKIENEPRLKQNVPTAATKEYIFNPTAPKFKTAYESTAFMVPSYSKNAEAVVKLVNYMQKGADQYNLFVYGVKDKDYKMVGDKVERTTKTDFFYNWMLFNIKFPVFESNIPDDYIETYKHWDDNAVASKWLGFSTNLDPIKTEKAKIDATWQERVYPMLAGLISYDKGFETAKKELDNAGWEKYFTELQKQFADYQATRK
jgi:putative aldouronate transport system substrate-binding protein